MIETTELFRLTQEAISSLENADKRLSDVIRSCIRIARLRNDYVNLIWLQREVIDNQNKYERQRAFGEIIPHFTKDQFDFYNKLFLEMWMQERPGIIWEDGTIQKTNLKIAKNVLELENELEGMINTHKRAQTPTGLHPLDTAKLDEQNFYLRIQTQEFINHYRNILEGIKNRVFDFLSQTEKQLMYGQFHADIFEQNRKYVELRLNQVCPDALKELVSALQRANEHTPAARAQALLSCRRLLKDFADALFPPIDKSMTGRDGKVRDLSDEKYINRLWQFISDSTCMTTSDELLQTCIIDLGNRLDHLNKLINKGVHANVDYFEMNQCMIQTYLIIGDILRINDQQSAVANCHGA